MFNHKFNSPNDKTFQENGKFSDPSNSATIRHSLKYEYRDSHWLYPKPILAVAEVSICTMKWKFFIGNLIFYTIRSLTQLFHLSQA